jgi:hypothetical protein
MQIENSNFWVKKEERMFCNVVIDSYKKMYIQIVNSTTDKSQQVKTKSKLNPIVQRINEYNAHILLSCMFISNPFSVIMLQ